MIDRPIEEVFAFLADGENDRKFSPRVLEIATTTDGPQNLTLRGARKGADDFGQSTKRAVEAS